jgi:3-deoxy-manno-octulosonate cytidylyltransferase (CMP-KDO synthetase)
MSTDYRIVIPARMASERLPGKPLLDVCGKPLLQRVWECATRSSAAEVLIATDDEQIRDAAFGFGADCQMTRTDHSSGSDRIAECLETLGWPDDTLVVNLQGDEPEMPPECLDQVAALLDRDVGADAASLYQEIDDPEEIRDPNAVKIVIGKQGRAIYFSRSVIPAHRAWKSIEAAIESGERWKRHVGLYAYRAQALKRFAAHPPTPLELLERLEQLRIIESGGVIAMAKAARPVPGGVDTPEDLERVRRVFR